MIKKTMVYYIFTTYIITILCVDKINGKSISKLDTNWDQRGTTLGPPLGPNWEPLRRSEMGMKVALQDPKPLEISQLEESVFSSLKHIFEDENKKTF